MAEKSPEYQFIRTILCHYYLENNQKTKEIGIDQKSWP